uniref:E3 ubiquitin-protein ligase RNF26 n=1 Tax=Scophthalmus maximus TaxID=52904 RepID=A0A8D3EFE3_SCOMX
MASAAHARGDTHETDSHCDFLSLQSTTDEVAVLFLAVGDACRLLLHLLVTMLSLSGSTLVQYWNFALLSVLVAAEAVSGAARGALRAMEGWLQTLGGVFESFKMVGHLFCHMAWRTKDALHRGFILACCLLRLALYVVNTVVNVVLIGTQNCLTVVAGVWETVAAPVHRVAELTLTLLTFLYSCLVGVSVLLWTPCQLLLDFLGALGRVFITVFMFDSQGLLATAAIVSLALLVLNPGLPALVGRLSLRLVNALPGARGVQTTVRRLYTAMLEPALAYRAAHTRTTQGVSRTRLLNTDTRGVTTEPDLLPVNVPSRPNSVQLPTRRDGELASGGGSRTSTFRPKPAAEDGELLSLLNEQEERKKCVICQDFNKTVLLLPCRHLCLCRHCADILTERRPSQQRCCPLCRQNITQTLDVFL